jgi:hypothetical protein
MERWSPHLSLIGDFHTHPYASLAEVRETEGWKFSKADVEALQNDDFLWDKADGHPVALVVTVCRLGRVPATFGTMPVGDAVESFDVGDGVILDLGNRFSNAAGDRIAKHVR